MTSGVMVSKILLSEHDQVSIVSTSRVQPEDSLGTSCLCPADSQLHPVLDGQVLGLAHTPDISSFYCVGEDRISSVVSHNNGTLGRDLESLVMAAVFLSLLSHQTYVGHVASRGPVKLSVSLAVLDDSVVHGGVAPVGDHALYLLEFVVFVPHLTTVSHNIWHGCVNNDIAGNMEISDAGIGVDHGKSGSGLILLHDVSLNFCLLRMSLDFVINIAKSVVYINFQFCEKVSVLSKDILEEDLDTVSEDDRVRHLHHGSFHVKGHHRLLVIAVLDLLLKESTESSSVHLGSINNLTSLKCKRFFEDLSCSVSLVQSDLDIACSWHDVALFAAEEISISHGCNDCSLAILLPWSHCWGPLGNLLGILFHWGSTATIRVTFSENGVDSRSENLGISSLDSFFLSILWVSRIVRDVVTLGLELSNALKELGDGSRDVGELDDVALRSLCKFSQSCKFVRNPLLWCQPFREVCNQTTSHRDVSLLNLNAHGLGKPLDDWQQGESCQHGCLITLGVDDLAEGIGGGGEPSVHSSSSKPHLGNRVSGLEKAEHFTSLVEVNQAILSL